MSDYSDKLRVGLIGTGDMARFYAQIIQQHIPDVRLVAISSQSIERAEVFAETFGIQSFYGQHDALFQEKLDAVIIASSSDTHASLLEEAARNRVDTFCDKPLGISQEEIDVALVAVNDSGIRLATGFNRRFDESFQHVHQQVMDGTVGRLGSILIISRDPEVPTPQELAIPNRLLLGTTIHDFDMARFLMGDEIISVFVQGSWLSADTVETEQIDCAVIALRFSRGGLGTIVNSYRSNEGYDQRLELYGSKGMCRVENNDVALDVSPDAPFFIKRYAASYLAELRSFFESIKGGNWDSRLATGIDGKIASSLSEAAIESWRRHEVVDL